MNFLRHLFFGKAGDRRPTEINMITLRERRRFARTMTGESAVLEAVRLGCIAG